MNKNLNCFFLICLSSKILIASSSLKPINMLMVLGSFPSFSEVFIYNQINGFSKKNCNLSIVARRKKSLNFTHSIISHNKLLKKVTYQNLPENLNDYDVIICQSGVLGNWFLSKCKKDFKSKLVVFFRGVDLSKDKYMVKGHYDKLLKRADICIPVCSYFKNKLVEMGCPENKTIVNHSAIDCNKFNFKKRTLASNEDINIISVARLVRKKGLVYSITAIAKLAKKYPGIRYRIIGRGYLKKTLQNLIKKLGVTNKVFISDAMPHEEVVKFLGNSHIFILPSITDKNGDEEGIPNALKEAMAMGLPVISTYHSGIPELIIHNKTGFLSKEKNILGLVDNLDYVIQNYNLLNNICSAARVKIEKDFNMEIENHKLWKIISNL